MNISPNKDVHCLHRALDAAFPWGEL